MLVEKKVVYYIEVECSHYSEDNTHICQVKFDSALDALDFQKHLRALHFEMDGIFEVSKDEVLFTHLSRKECIHKTDFHVFKKTTIIEKLCADNEQ